MAAPRVPLCPTFIRFRKFSQSRFDWAQSRQPGGELRDSTSARSLIVAAAKLETAGYTRSRDGPGLPRARLTTPRSFFSLSVCASPARNVTHAHVRRERKIAGQRARIHCPRMSGSRSMALRRLQFRVLTASVKHTTDVCDYRLLSVFLVIWVRLICETKCSHNKICCYCVIYHVVEVQINSQNLSRGSLKT